MQRGDLLFETLDGSFNGLYMSGIDITAGVDGTISRIDAQQGSAIQKDSVVAVLYPEGSMRIEAQIEEANLASIAVGDPVSIELLWNQDEDVTYDGTITMISAIADSADADDKTAEGETEDAVTYTVYIDFTPDENTRYGMSAVITTLEAQEAEAAREPEGVEEVSEDAQD